MKTAAALLLALVAAAAFADTASAVGYQAAPSFCRTSAYTVDCKVTEEIKLKMFKLCGKGVIRAVGKYIPNVNGCACSVVQKVDTPEAWDAFQKCQETLGAVDFKKLQDTRCKPGQAKGPC